jgi:hypothetical protein
MMMQHIWKGGTIDNAKRAVMGKRPIRMPSTLTDTSLFHRQAQPLRQCGGPEATNTNASACR